MPGLGAILLAAGGSVRMGRPKQLLPYKGESLVRRAASAAVEVGCRPVIVVLGCRHEDVLATLDGLPVETANNADWKRGIGSSLRCGVRRLGEIDPGVDAAVLLLCDQPHVTAATLVRLIDGFRQSGKGVCVSAYAGTLGPPVVVGRERFPDLLQLPDDRGAKSLWVDAPDRVHIVPCDEAAVDVDTPTDFERLA